MIASFGALLRDVLELRVRRAARAATARARAAPPAAAPRGARPPLVPERRPAVARPSAARWDHAVGRGRVPPPMGLRRSHADRKTGGRRPAARHQPHDRSQRERSEAHDGLVLAARATRPQPQRTLPRPRDAGARALRRAAAAPDARGARRADRGADRRRRAPVRARPLPGGVLPGRGLRRRRAGAAASTAASIPTSARPPGSRSPGTRAAPRAGSTSRFPPTRRSWKARSRWRGGRWTRSTRRTSGSSATPPTRITASTSAARRAIWSCAPATASSPTRRARWCCTSRASRRAGTCRARTSTATRSRGRGADVLPVQGHRRPTTTSATRASAAWSYRAPLEEMERIGDLVSFEPDRVEVTLDGERLELEPGQNVVSHGLDRDLSVGEAGALVL